MLERGMGRLLHLHMVVSFAPHTFFVMSWILSNSPKTKIGYFSPYSDDAPATSYVADNPGFSPFVMKTMTSSMDPTFHLIQGYYVHKEVGRSPEQKHLSGTIKK